LLIAILIIVVFVLSKLKKKKKEMKDVLGKIEERYKKVYSVKPGEV
ncbi:unnamed protein product, partial [marine sediment metagenome]